ncbi:acid protease [Peniophora sp. CONT]|nr:acid protease [Peniophora sp. CONT]
MLSSLIPVCALVAPAALALSIPYPRSFEPGQHVPLARRGVNLAARWDGDADMNVMFTMANCTRVKYNYTNPSDCSTMLPAASGSRRSLQSRQSQGNANLTDFGQDVSYFASIDVGSPAQTFDVVMDTGSSDLWIETTQCTNCPRGSAQLDTGRSSSISTTSNDVSFSYGQGRAQGTMATDSVSLAGFNISSQTFGAVTQIFDNVVPNAASGIMGLAFQSLARTGATPFWQALLNNNQLSNPEFSVYLARNQQKGASSTSSNDGGSITFGGRNTTLFQGDVDFQNFPSGTSNAFWYQNVASLTVNGNSVGINSGLAAIDTGTTLLGGPQDSVSDFWNQVSGSRSIGNGMYSYPCSTSLNVTISFGGRSFPINPSDLNFGRVGNGQCVGAIFSMQGSASGSNPAWIVGDTFLKNVYTVFRANPASVGFAELSDVAGGSSGTPGAGPASNPGTSNNNNRNSNNSSARSRSQASSLVLSFIGLLGVYLSL